MYNFHNHKKENITCAKVLIKHKETKGVVCEKATT